MALLAMMMLLAGCSGRRAEMRERLQALNAVNRADTVLTATHRDEAQELADWFDRHGSANEQMLAHYLLGRCYADMHEAPMALHCYQEAISRADTTAADCDFAQLSRVYGQPALIFYQQGLYRNQLEYEDIASAYAWRGNDTLAALRCYAMKGAAYDQLQMKDSAILIYKNAVELLKLYKYNKVAAGFSGAIAKKLIDKGEMSKALPYLQEYERNSGYFNSVGIIEKGREIYYYWKGLYYLQINQLDSAEYYFRKELRTGKDFNNQNCGAYGLSLLFQQQQRYDSAAKYSHYSYAMNDSMYAYKATQEVEQAKAMYDYTRNQELAQKKEIEANKERAQKERIFYVSLGLLFLLGFIYMKWSHKKKEYQTLLAAHKQAESELSTLQELQSDFLANAELHKENLSRLSTLVKKKETEVEKLRLTIKKNKNADRENRLAKAAAMARMAQSDVYQSIIIKINRGNTLTAEEWIAMDRLIAEYLPSIHSFLESKRSQLSFNKYSICQLILLNVPPQRISMILGIHPSYVSKAREQMHELFFGTKGTAKQFDKKLQGL